MLQNFISLRILCTSITKRALSWFDRFTVYYNCLSKNITKHISQRVWAQASQFVFPFDLTVLQLITTVWRKMSQISYLRELCEQVSQIVLFSDLTVLQLVTTVWGKMSQILYLPEFLEQVSQIVFLAYFIVLGLFTINKKKCHKTHIYASSVHKYHKSCS